MVCFVWEKLNCFSVMEALGQRLEHFGEMAEVKVRSLSMNSRKQFPSTIFPRIYYTISTNFHKQFRSRFNDVKAPFTRLQLLSA